MSEEKIYSSSDINKLEECLQMNKLIVSCEESIAGFWEGFLVSLMFGIAGLLSAVVMVLSPYKTNLLLLFSCAVFSVFWTYKAIGIYQKNKMTKSRLSRLRTRFDDLHASLPDSLKQFWVLYRISSFEAKVDASQRASPDDSSSA